MFRFSECKENINKSLVFFTFFYLNFKQNNVFLFPSIFKFLSGIQYLLLHHLFSNQDKSYDQNHELIKSNNILRNFCKGAS